MSWYIKFWDAILHAADNGEQELDFKCPDKATADWLFLEATKMGIVVATYQTEGEFYINALIPND